MARDVLIYLSFHEPWRLKLPIEPIPPGADLETIQNCVFDLGATQYFFDRWKEEVCGPYARLLRRLIEDGASFLVSISGPLLQMLAQDQSDSSRDFLNLLQHSSICPVSSDTKNGLSFYLDIDLFRLEMEKGRDLAASVFGRQPMVAMAPLTAINNEIYYVCQQLGFSGVIADGTWDLLRGRASSQFYRNGLGPVVAIRNSDLSLKTAAMLTERDQTSYPVSAFPLATKIIEYPADTLLLGWQVGLFDENRSCANECAILEGFLYQIVQQGIGFSKFDDLLRPQRNVYSSLQLPSIPAVSSEFGSIFYFLGHPAQQDIFCLMRQAFSIARLTQREDLIGVASTMAQWDILALLHQVTISNGNDRQMYYFAPGAHNYVSANDVVLRLHQFYEHFIQRLTDDYL